MIIGIGLDLVDVAAFRAQLDEVGTAFVTHTFTPAERTFASAAGKDPARHLAVRFAAKEALVKAWSSSRWGATPQLTRVDLREIEVSSDAHGRPSLVLHGRIEEAIEALGPTRLHLSLTHDGGTAAAVVVLEQRPA